MPGPARAGLEVTAWDWTVFAPADDPLLDLGRPTGLRVVADKCEDAAGFQVDVADLERAELGGADAGVEQEEHDGAVAGPGGGDVVIALFLAGSAVGA